MEPWRTNRRGRARKHPATWSGVERPTVGGPGGRPSTELAAVGPRSTACPAAALEQLGMSAYLINRDDDAFRALGRAHAALRSTAAPRWTPRAARSGSSLDALLDRGEPARARGWLARAESQRCSPTSRRATASSAATSWCSRALLMHRSRLATSTPLHAEASTVVGRGSLPAVRRSADLVAVRAARWRGPRRRVRSGPDQRRASRCWTRPWSR